MHSALALRSICNLLQSFFFLSLSLSLSLSHSLSFRKLNLQNKVFSVLTLIFFSTNFLYFNSKSFFGNQINSKVIFQSENCKDFYHSHPSFMDWILWNLIEKAIWYSFIVFNFKSRFTLNILYLTKKNDVKMYHLEFNKLQQIWLDAHDILSIRC